MIVKIFRNNRISGIAWTLLVWAAGVYVHFILESPRDFDGFWQFFPILTAEKIRALAGALLILINTVIYNGLFIRLNQFDQTTGLPGYFFMLVSIMFPGIETGIGIFFLLLALFFIHAPPGRIRSDAGIFNAGICLAISGITYLPLCVFAILGPVLPAITGKFTFRHLFMYYTAYLIPWLYLFFLLDYYQHLELLPVYLPLWFSLPAQLGNWSTGIWLTLGFMLISGFYGLWKYSRFSGRMKVAQRQTFTLFSLIFWILLFSGLGFRNLHSGHFQLMAVPLGLFSAFALIHEKNRRVVFIFFVLWTAAAFLPLMFPEIPRFFAEAHP